ncbi:MAG: AAA family ATPase [Saprospiraceae bacterium]
MKQKITHIKRVIIKKLWRRKDVNIDWQLNADVNVLSGDNGSGKSTVLRLIGKLLSSEFIEDSFEAFQIEFNNGDILEFKWEEKFYSDYINELREPHTKYVAKKKIKDDAVVLGGYRCLNGNYESDSNQQLFQNIANTTILNNTEQPLISKETLQKLGTNISTYLDWEIDKLQRQYADYQINIGKRVIARLEKGENHVKEITASKNLFFNLIDDLFKDTNKVIDREANNIVFIQNSQYKIKTHQLSTGEKQLLIILLSALVQDKKPTIMIMDEPELSLHPDWQEKIIHNVRKLNPNVQLIIATHSPFIIMNGWTDKVFEMSKITINN